MAAPDPEALRRHLLSELLPLWAQRAADAEYGGWHGRLSRSLEPLRDEPKRLRVHTRLLWAFSEGVRLGGGAPLREASARARAFLTEAFSDREGGGYWLMLERDRTPARPEKELYDHAFAILALAHHGAVFDDSGSIEEAAAVLDWLRERLADRVAGGFFERLSADGRVDRAARRQNPHMHLLEALLVLERARPETSTRALADRLVDLLRDRFVEPSGALREHFDPDWGPLPGGGHGDVEPGHHFEWVWLLHRHAAARGTLPVPEARELWDFALRHGLADDGGVLDAVDARGRPLRRTRRLWPQTEHLKACLARGEADLAAAALDRLRARYLDGDTGGWIEHLDEAGRPLPGPMNATSVYHVTLALSEAIGAAGG